MGTLVKRSFSLWRFISSCPTAFATCSLSDFRLSGCLQLRVMIVFTLPAIAQHSSVKGQMGGGGGGGGGYVDIMKY